MYIIYLTLLRLVNAMTRINVLPLDELSDEHLFAEYRELPRICNYLRRTINSKYGLRREEIPKYYTMGFGHVRFFYDKGQWVEQRYAAIYKELLKRNRWALTMPPTFDVTIFKENGLYHGWFPLEREKETNRKRIRNRIYSNPTYYHYYGVPINESKTYKGVRYGTEVC